uniref:Uncharacterized protein n=1 Tax=Apteryx owenii TaxID=8824 RepID=A0A8B9NW41_APTOW
VLPHGSRRPGRTPPCAFGGCWRAHAGGCVVRCREHPWVQVCPSTCGRWRGPPPFKSTPMPRWAQATPLPALGSLLHQAAGGCEPLAGDAPAQTPSCPLQPAPAAHPARALAAAGAAQQLTWGP